MLETSTIAIYVIVDDLLLSMGHREARQRKINDSEVITTLFISSLYFGGNIEKSRLYMKTSCHIPQMLSKSQLNRRIHQSSTLLYQLFEWLAEHFKSQIPHNRYLLDIFPVAVCHNIRISRFKLLQGEQFRGKCVSKRTYFYGFKMAVITTEEGLPVELCFLPGRYADVKALNTLPRHLPPGSERYGDGGFTDYQAEDLAKELDHISFEICRKNNSQRGDLYAIKLWKTQMRKYIESTFSAISGLMPKKIHAVTIEGFCLKVFMFIFGYGIDRWFVGLPFFRTIKLPIIVGYQLSI